MAATLGLLLALVGCADAGTIPVKWKAISCAKVDAKGKLHKSGCGNGWNAGAVSSIGFINDITLEFQCTVKQHSMIGFGKINNHNSYQVAATTSTARTFIHLNMFPLRGAGYRLRRLLRPGYFPSLRAWAPQLQWVYAHLSSFVCPAGPIGRARASIHSSSEVRPRAFTVHSNAILR